MGPDLFLCESFSCRLTPAACIARQAKAETTAKATEISALAFARCGSCEQGRQVRAELERTGQLLAVQAKSDELRSHRNKAFWQRVRAKPATSTGSTVRPQPAPAEVAPITEPAPPAIENETTMEKPCVKCGVSRLRLSPAGRCKRCEAEAASATKPVETEKQYPASDQQAEQQAEQPAAAEELRALSNAELAVLLADTAKVLTDARAEADRRLADLDALRSAREAA